VLPVTVPYRKKDVRAAQKGSRRPPGDGIADIRGRDAGADAP
jgi:hypothetical protein